MTLNFFSKFFYFAIALLPVVLIFNGKCYIHKSSVPYLLLSAIMAAFSFSGGALSMLRKLVFAAVYVFAYDQILRNSNHRAPSVRTAKAERDVTIMLFTMAYGSFVHLMLNFFKNMGQPTGRNTIDIWTDSVLNATGQAVLGSLMVGISVRMMLVPKKRVERYVGMIITVLMLLYNLILGGRTMVAMYIILFAVGVIYVTVKFKDRREKNSMYTWIFIMVIAAAILLIFNVFGIRDIVVGSNLFKRFFGTADIEVGLFDTGRSDKKINYLLHMYKYPFGGLHLRAQYGYAHDLLLDSYDEFGVFAFIMLVVILIKGIRDMLIFLRSSAYSNKFKLEMLLIYLAILMIFCLEPIFAGVSWLFVCYCIVNACVATLNIIEKNTKAEIHASSSSVTAADTAG